MSHELQFLGLAPVHGARALQEQAPGITRNPVEGLDCNWYIHGRKHISQQPESCTHYSLPEPGYQVRLPNIAGVAVTDLVLHS